MQIAARDVRKEGQCSMVPRPWDPKATRLSLKAGNPETKTLDNIDC